MKNWPLFIGLIIVLIVLIWSVSNNIQIYNANGEYNWGTGGGVNKFMNGLIMNGVEVLILIVGLYILSKQFKDKKPVGLIPAYD